jgi:hypothetical protein
MYVMKVNSNLQKYLLYYKCRNTKHIINNAPRTHTIQVQTLLLEYGSLQADSSPVTREQRQYRMQGTR